MSRQIGRREALSLLGAAAWASAQNPAIRFVTLDHVQISVPDAAKSAAFYARIFGAPIWKNNQTPRRYIRLGPSYLVADQGQPTGRVDHFSTGIEGFVIANIHTYLDQRGIPYRDFPSGRDLSVADPDDIRLELSAANTWSQLEGRTASPELGPAVEGILRPTGIDHILLNVTDPEKSAAFYEKILGPVTQRNNNRIWFQAGVSRIGLLKTPAGQSAGVNHFCVSAAAFDYDTVMKKLEQAGAKPETAEVAGNPEFRDPDGFLVQIMRAQITTPRAP